jgi:hexokinase
MKRAAKLVTINLSSVIQKTWKGMNACKPVCIAAEGTIFYKSRLFRGKLDYYIKNIS